MRSLAGIMAALVLACTGMAVLILFRTAIESQEHWLTQLVDSQMQFIKATYNANDRDLGKTFRIVKDAHAGYQFRDFHNSGEFVLVRNTGNGILLMFGLKDGHAIGMTQVSSAAPEATLLGLALNSGGKTAGYIGRDRAGHRVIAGYGSLPELGWGLIAKVDLVEVAAPFVRAGLAAGLIAVIGIWLGTRAFQRINEPLTKRIAEARDFAENLVRNLALPTFVVDASHRVLVWNRAAEHLTGVAASDIVGSREQWRGFYRSPRPCLADLVIEGGANTSGHLYQSMGAGPHVTGGLTAEGWCEMPDGSRRYLGLDAGPILDSNGRLLAVVQTVHDLTEAKNLENALLQARDQALVASRAKSEFLATMSHELRTPMNGVLGMLDILRGARLNTDQRNYVEIAHQSAVSLLDIINDILDISKIEAGKLEMERVDMDIREVVDDVCRMLAPRAHAKGLELVAYVQPGAPTAVYGDPTRLRQILINLIGNAVKFTERGQVSLVAECVAVSETSMMLRVEVDDTGVGIPEAVMARLFRVFSQADGSTTRKFGGTGLGLAICKQLVELMDGDIGVDSEPGKGAKFWFTLKFDRHHEKLPDTLDSELSGLHVLVVDDNATSRNVIECYLEAWGTKVKGVSNGTAALAELRRAAVEGERCDVVLADAQMPGMDGLALLQQLQAAPELAAIQRILLLNAADQPDCKMLTAAGVACHLQKPIRQGQLREALGKLLSRQEVPPPAEDLPSDGRLIGRRVLLVEDNPVNQVVASTMLANLGVAVAVAENGREAVDLAASDRFDVILMDCQMPEMDGFSATRAIREREADAGLARQIIIAMTANAMKGDRQRCLDAGMDDYLAKPVQIADVERHLLRWCPIRSPRENEAGDRDMPQMNPLRSGLIA